LTKLGFTIVQLPSAGGFLNRANITLLIGMPAGREEAAVRALKASCSQRIEYLPSPLPNMPEAAAAATEVSVGGATIFTFEVESYDEF
jgi:uncharacterized protein YaaQ